MERGPRRTGSQGIALWLLGVCTAALAYTIAAQLGTEPFGKTWLIQTFVGVGLVTSVTGLWLWFRRPSNRCGPLLFVVGLLELAGAAGNVPERWLALVGVLLAEAPIAALAHLVLAFPSGRTTTRTETWLVRAAYTVAVGFQVPLYVVAPDSAVFPTLHVAVDPDLYEFLDDVQGWVFTAVLVVSSVVVLRRWWSAPAERERRTLGVVTAYGVFALLSFPLSARLLRPVLGWDVFVLFGVQQVVVLGLPFVVVGAILSGAFARTVEIAELATILGTDDPAPMAAEQAVARAIGDPSARLLFGVDGADGYVDGAGRELELVPRPGRKAVILKGRTGEAVIEYDASMVADAELVKAAGRVVLLAMERERLTAELHASEAELRRSRQRIVEQADDERRRLARDLHDGVQSRLVAVAIHAGRLASDEQAAGREQTAAAAAAVRDQIDSAITELRHLVHGVTPPLLEERGLFAAVEDLADRVPLPCRLAFVGHDGDLPWAVASAGYYIVAEALSNAVKHASATTLEVTVRVGGGAVRIEVDDDGVGGAARSRTGGAGLRGLADRATAFGGFVRITDREQGGTTIVAELPCVP